MADVPNRVILVGPEALLKTQIISEIDSYFRLKNLSVESEGRGHYRPPIYYKFNDKLQITINFRGINPANNKIHTVEKSWRLMAIDPKTVTADFIKALGLKVQQKFNTLIFTTGHIKVKYTDRRHGYAFWGYFNNRQDGYRLYESILDIQNHSMELELLRYEEVGNPTEIFKNPGEKIQLAGKTVRTRSIAPIVPMKFLYASVTFPWIGHTEKLCDNKNYVIRNLNFLEDYDD